jgi:GDP-4-dehydro-6-deoxy-D-mannose reductase
MRVLITGAGGFVGPHLVTALRERGHEAVRTERHPAEDSLAVDVTQPLELRGAIELVRPDAVAHLAALAFVPASIDDPAATFAVNATGTMNVLDALRAARGENPSPRVLIVSSGDVYGAHAPAAYPLRETVAPLPRNPYAASKIAAEALALAYARTFGLDVVVTRAFNHIGAGQHKHFAVPSFALQLARIASGGDSLLFVGNLAASRDFLDVRDVCAAYVALLEGGGAAGEIYNVCSGKATTMREVLRQLITIAGVPVEVREDPARMRPADIPLSVGDASKLRDATGWAPRIPLTAALRAVYEDACTRLEVPL